MKAEGGSEPRLHESYRADIDGLRAVAVVSVLGFHFFPEWVPGGFVGVDVFFVISGYLITGILLDGLRNGSFRLTDFYARRVRRIFPSLLVVSQVCLAFGWLVLLPDEYGQLGKHVFAGATFVSNLALWREAGYFDAVADTKPLLHLWSLGIEEQFYLAWPLFVAFAWRRGRGVFRPTLLVALASFAMSLVILDRDPSSAFYFPITRFWELLIGALLSATQRGVRAQQGPAASPDAFAVAIDPNLRSLSGAALIGFSLFAFDRNTAFPGWSALLPTLGAYHLISAGPVAWFNRVALSGRPMVWIGLTSFPLYLWHWPLFSLARIVGSAPPSPLVRIVLCCTSLLLASLTYVFIEKPIRFTRRRRLSIALLTLGMLGTGLAGLAVYSGEGVPSRFSDPAILAATMDLNDGGWGPSADRQVDCANRFPEARGFDRSCRLSSDRVPTLAILGDSHAWHLFSGLSQMDPARTWLLIYRSGCPPTSGITINFDGPGCEYSTEAALKYILGTPSIHTVVLSFFSGYLADSVFAADHVARGMRGARITSREFQSRDKNDLFLLGLDRVATQIESRGKTVILFGDIPELPFFPRDCLRQFMKGAGNNDGCSLPKSAVLERQKNYRKLLERLALDHPKARLFDSLNVLCPAGVCLFRNNEMLFYRDSHHLSNRGSAWMAQGFLEWLALSHPAKPHPEPVRKSNDE